jgi:hypothetical protein
VSKCVQIQEIGQKEKSASTDNQQLADLKGTQSGSSLDKSIYLIMFHIVMKIKLLLF